MNRIDCTEALRLAQEALRDDQRATPGPWREEQWSGEDGGWRATGPHHDDPNGEDWPDSEPHEAAKVDSSLIAAARTREPKLAAFVEAVLGDRAAIAQRVNVIDGLIVVSAHAPKMDGSHVKLRLPARAARALAAALLHAADEAERG
jgi:hypothetical protein